MNLKITALFFALLLILSVPLTRAQSTRPAPLPDSSAAKLFSAWLAAVNSGNIETTRQFISQNFAPPPNGSLPIDQMATHDANSLKETGGLTVQSFLNETPTRIAVLLQENNTGYTHEVRMALAPGNPLRIAGVANRNTPTPAEFLPHTPLSDQEIAARADALITTLAAADKFSGVLYVARGNQPIYSRAAGLASRQWNQANHLDTKFNLGSIAKMFTATGIAQLVEQGKLTFTETLAEALPSYPDQDLAAKVTIAQLLSHTSGISNPDSSTGDKLAALVRRHFLTVDQYLPKTPVDTLAFTPGSRIQYDNYGYILLGAIIEKASGEDYFDYVRRHIFQPAGMTDTDNYELDTEPSNLATGYMDASGGRRSNIFSNFAKGIPAGGAYSTAPDMVKFSIALRNHTLLKESSLDELWTGRMDYLGRGQYGYGCTIAEYNGRKIVGHGGGWFGVTDHFEILPALDTTVVILTNIDDDPDPIIYKLREWLTQGR